MDFKTEAYPGNFKSVSILANFSIIIKSYNFLVF